MENQICFVRSVTWFALAQICHKEVFEKGNQSFHIHKKTCCKQVTANSTQFEENTKLTFTLQYI